MSNLKLALLFLFKTLAITSYSLIILFTAVNGYWVVTTILLMTPLSTMYLEEFIKIIKIKNKLKRSEEKVEELRKNIEKNQKKMDNKDDIDE